MADTIIVEANQIHAQTWNSLNSAIKQRLKSPTITGQLSKQYTVKAFRVSKIIRAEITSLYLTTINDAQYRQHCNCTTCLNFIRRYGDLVVKTMSPEGERRLEWLLWTGLENVPSEHTDFINKVNGMLPDITLGTPFIPPVNLDGYNNKSYTDTNQSEHFFIPNIETLSFYHNKKYTYDKEKQAHTADKLDGYFNPLMLTQLRQWYEVNSNRLNRSEQVLSVIDKLTKAAEYDDYMIASLGYSKVRNTAIGELINNLFTDLEKLKITKLNLDNVEHAVKAYNSMTHYTTYKVAERKATDNDFNLAEKALTEMEYTTSLNMEHMSLNDLRSNELLLWEPTVKEVKEKPKGMFDSVKTQTNDNEEKPMLGEELFLEYDSLLALLQNKDIVIHEIKPVQNALPLIRFFQPHDKEAKKLFITPNGLSWSATASYMTIISKMHNLPIKAIAMLPVGSDPRLKIYEAFVFVSELPSVEPVQTSLHKELLNPEVLPYARAIQTYGERTKVISIAEKGVAYGVGFFKHNATTAQTLTVFKAVITYTKDNILYKRTLSLTTSLPKVTI